MIKAPTTRYLTQAGIALMTTTWLVPCSPTVKLQAPDEPIRFDVNVNVTQEVRIKIDQELQEAFKANPELFGLAPMAGQSSSQQN